jgi:putative phosphoesterase
MRILLIADVHANQAALEAVTEPYDVCLCLGDLVEYGPEPGGCVEWVRKRAAYTVRGNHDHGAAQDVEVQGLGGFRYLTQATRRPTLAKLSTDDRRYLNDLPTTSMFKLGGKRFLLVHATPRDPLDEYIPAEVEPWAARLAGVHADYVCVGHTHQQFIIPVSGTRVINPGSIGLQRDGDPRARYAVIDGDDVQLKKVEYDVEKTVTAVRECSLIDERAKTMLTEVYRNGRMAYANGKNGNGNGTNGTNGNGKH